ncbi:MAG: carbohydrate kinase family protein [Chloroflexota bacterium]
MISPRRVVVAGHICLDIIPRIERIPAQGLSGLLQPGHLFNIGPAALSTGGAVSNTGLALHKLGVPTCLVAKVGADPLAETIRAVVDAFGPGLSDGLVTDPAVGSSYTIIISAPEVDRIFWHCPAANDAFGADDIDDDLLRQAALLHFGYPPLMRRIVEDGAAELLALLRRAKVAGISTSLDMSFPDPESVGGQADWRAILAAALPDVDIFTPSIDELLFMQQRATYERLAARPGGLLAHVTPELLSGLSAELLAWGAKIVMIKTGPRGAYLRTAGVPRLAQMGRGVPGDLAAWADRELWAPCFAVDVVGTTGSGDATIAGFLAALLRDRSPAEAMTAAVAVGACNVEAADALGGLRTWEETLARIAAGWPRCSWPLAAPGWEWSATLNLWQKAH